MTTTERTLERYSREFTHIHSWFDRYWNRLDEQAYVIRLVVNWLSSLSTRLGSTSLGERYYTFKMALNWHLQHGGSTIVETGSLREPGSWFGVGCSTHLFGEFVSRYGGYLWSCDIDESVIERARAETSEFSAHIDYVCDDSITFLQGFDQTIDLLYLDSMDCPRRGDASAAQYHNLGELEAAYPKLTPNAVVLLDDNRFRNGGKPLLSKELLYENGWVCLFDWHQSLWVRTPADPVPAFHGAETTLSGRR